MGNTGRHRLAVGSIRLVDDGAGNWTLAPVHRPSFPIGRVGALAVFLGVGGALAALPGTASADTGSSEAGAASGSRGVHSAPDRSRNTARPGTAAIKPAVSLRAPSPAAAVAPAAAVTRPAAAVVSGPLSAPAVTSSRLAAGKQIVINVAGGGNPGVALQGALASFNTDPAFANITLNSVLSDPAMPQAWGQAANTLVVGLAGDADVRAALAARLSDSVTAALGNTASAAGVGTAVGSALTGLLSDPAAANALGSVAGTFVTGLLSQPGVSAEVAGVTRTVVAGLAGQDPNGALTAAWRTLQAGPAFRAGVGTAVSTAVNTALTDSGLVNAVGTAVTGVVSGVAADPALVSSITGALGPTYGPAAAHHLAAALLGQPAVPLPSTFAPHRLL